MIVPGFLEDPPTTIQTRWDAQFFCLMRDLLLIVCHRLRWRLLPRPSLLKAADERHEGGWGDPQQRYRLLVFFTLPVELTGRRSRATNSPPRTADVHHLSVLARATILRRDTCVPQWVGSLYIAVSLEHVLPVPQAVRTARRSPPRFAGSDHASACMQKGKQYKGVCL